MSKKKQDTLYAEDTRIQPVIRTHHNAPLLPKHHEHNTQPSNTIPDQSLPLRTILDRYTRGLPMDIPVTANMYEGESEFDIPDLRTLDLADQQEIMEKAREQTKALERRLQEQARERKKAQVQKLIEEQKQKIIKEQKSEHGFRNADQAQQPPPSL